MKKQYTATWFTLDGNRHELYPLYAVSDEAARGQVIDFIVNYQKKGKLTDLTSIVLS